MGEPILVFDGDCGFCTWAAKWIICHADQPVRAVPWQDADLERLGLSEGEAQTTVWWVETGESTQAPTAGARSAGHLAIARALLRCRGGWPLVGRALLLPGMQRLAASAYGLVARHRGRLPGAVPARRGGWRAGIRELPDRRTRR